MERKETLIVGGTGKTGKRVAERLRARGVPVRIGSRSAQPAFDWLDDASWDAVLDGVRAMYVTYYPDLAVPSAAPHVRALVTRAVRAGVERIVLLSGRGEEQVHASEQAVRESGVAHTILRAAWFAQNFSEGTLRDPVLAGEVAFPAGNVAEPFIDADDIADAAVIALTEPGHDGKTYELTGPRLLTFADATAEIARASGRPVRYVPVSFEAYADALAPFMPREEVSFFTGLFRHLLDGHNAFVTDGVERVLGRKPRDFRAYAEAAVASGAWA